MFHDKGRVKLRGRRRGKIWDGLNTVSEWIDSLNGDKKRDLSTNQIRWVRRGCFCCAFCSLQLNECSGAGMNTAWNQEVDLNLRCYDVMIKLFNWHVHSDVLILQFCVPELLEQPLSHAVGRGRPHLGHRIDRARGEKETAAWVFELLVACTWCFCKSCWKIRSDVFAGHYEDTPCCWFAPLFYFGIMDRINEESLYFLPRLVVVRHCTSSWGVQIEQDQVHFASTWWVFPSEVKLKPITQLPTGKGSFCILLRRNFQSEPLLSLFSLTFERLPRHKLEQNTDRCWHRISISPRISGRIS